jgi:aspartate/methionine/tyrosine aminotransferase
MSPPESSLNPLAKALNERLAAAAPEVAAMLSPLGRGLYFPKGILSQSAEASEKASRYNATIGIATEGGEAMHLGSVARHLKDISADDAFPYAPAGGRKSLRDRWLAKQRHENPNMVGKQVGLPIVTSALTHGLGLVGDLFVGAGDRLFLPDKLWGNYRLTYEVRYGASLGTFPLFADDGFNLAGFREGLAREAAEHDKLIVLLNFPNNPTGYMPSEAENAEIAAALIDLARAGTKLVVVCDDAYFGLFYHLGGASATQSLFGQLVGEHENLLAVRLDGATKELFVWGLRCGFLTLGPGRADTAAEVCDVLDTKLRGAIRSGVSNSPLLSQTLVERCLADPSSVAEREEKCAVLRARAERVDAAARDPRFADSWDVYPFNSGYFMCVELKEVPAEAVRTHLLDHYQTGLIATAERDLRVAFSCLELDEIEPMFELVDRAVRELR